MCGVGLVPTGDGEMDSPDPLVSGMMLGFPAPAPSFRDRDADPETHPEPVVGVWCPPAPLPRPHLPPSRAVSPRQPEVPSC